jgi:hypothetical protein
MNADRCSFVRLATLALLVLCAPLIACVDPAEQCAGNIEVSCDAEGCTCADGAFEGDPCLDEPNSTDPDACENLCCGEGEGIGGPPSVLKGTL